MLQAEPKDFISAKTILTAIGLIFVFYALVMQTEKLP